MLAYKPTPTTRNVKIEQKIVGLYASIYGRFLVEILILEGLNL